MTTDFDIGDIIKFSAVATILSYEATNAGDCYTMELKDINDNNPIFRVYLGTDELRAANAHKIN